MPVLLCSLLLAVPAPLRAASSIMVEPMLIERSDFVPGRGYTLTLSVRNSNPNEEARVSLFKTGLQQADSANWSLAEPDPDNAFSSLSWITIPQEILTLPPLSSRDVTVSVKVPTKVKGSFYSVVVVRTEPQMRPGTIPLVMQFAVPMLFTVHGSSVRVDGAVMDAGFENDPAGNAQLWLAVENRSDVIAKASGEAVIHSVNDGTLRRLAQVPLEGRRMLPRQTVKVLSELQRKLPVGEYVIKARMQMDNRRLRPFETTVSVTEAAGGGAGPAVSFTPEPFELNAPPGARRGGTLQVLNTDLRPVTVTLKAQSRPSLSAGRGARFDAAPWLQISPETFTLEPMRRRNVQVTVQRPAGAERLPQTYANLLAVLTVQDGQVRYEKPVPVVIKDSAAPEAPVSVELAPLRLELAPAGAREAESAEPGETGQEARQVLLTTVRNSGDLRLELQASAYVTDESGLKRLGTFTLDEEQRTLLPEELWELTVQLDSAQLESEGAYSLVLAVYGNGVEERLSLPVRLQGEEKIFEPLAP